MVMAELGILAPLLYRLAHPEDVPDQTGGEVSHGAASKRERRRSGTYGRRAPSFWSSVPKTSLPGNARSIAGTTDSRHGASCAKWPPRSGRSNDPTKSESPMPTMSSPAEAGCIWSTSSTSIDGGWSAGP